MSSPAFADTGRRKISYSQISTFLKCPRQYRYKYIEKLPQKPSIVPMQSQAWHAVVEKNYIFKMRSKRDLPLKRMLELYKYELKKMLVYAGGWEKVDHGKFLTFEEVMLQGLDITEKHHKLLAPKIKPLGTEVKFQVQFNKEVDIIGVWDLLEKDTVADNKAFGRTPNQDDFDKDIQFTLYAWAYEKMYKKIPQLRMDCMVKNKEVKAVQLWTKRNKRSLKWFEGMVEDVVAAMKGGGYFPNTNGWHCNQLYCSFWDNCMGG